MVFAMMKQTIKIVILMEAIVVDHVSTLTTVQAAIAKKDLLENLLQTFFLVMVFAMINTTTRPVASTMVIVACLILKETIALNANVI